MKDHKYDCANCGRADRGMDAEGNEEYCCEDKYNGICHYEGIDKHWIVECISEVGRNITCNQCETVFHNPERLWNYCPECGQLMGGRYKYKEDIDE